jgi:ribosomal protein S18 acetylase RimI-like enzyme
MSDGRFVVRFMRDSDIGAVHRIHLALFRIKYSVDFIASFLASNSLSLLLVRTDGPSETIVGVSMVFRQWASFFSTRRTAYLATFGIRRNFRRRGLGSFLFRLTCRILMTHCTVFEVSLHMVASKRSTFAFYIAQGLRPARVVKSYYTFGNKHRDAIVMRQELATVPRKAARSDVDVDPGLAVLLETTQRVCPLAQFFMVP